MLSRISYITLRVNECDACLAFYRDALGLPLETSDENFAQFATQGTKLYLHRLGINYLFGVMPWKSTSKFRMWMLCTASCLKEVCNASISPQICLGARAWRPFAILKEM